METSVLVTDTDASCSHTYLQVQLGTMLWVLIRSIKSIQEDISGIT